MSVSVSGSVAKVARAWVRKLVLVLGVWPKCTTQKPIIVCDLL